MHVCCVASQYKDLALAFCPKPFRLVSVCLIARALGAVDARLARLYSLRGVASDRPRHVAIWSRLGTWNASGSGPAGESPCGMVAELGRVGQHHPKTRMKSSQYWDDGRPPGLVSSQHWDDFILVLG